MIAYRVFPHDTSAHADRPGGPLWFPREWQGSGRHDNPDRYACLYVSETPLSPVAEALARFRGADLLLPSMLTRTARPLALAALDMGDAAQLIDLDEPRVLVKERLRPSRVASGHRKRTQADALDLFERHPGCTGLRWWSSLEASWLNVTLFDRGAPLLSVTEVRPLTLDDPVVLEATDALGIPVAA